MDRHPLAAVPASANRGAGHFKANRYSVSITPIEADLQTGTQVGLHIQVTVTDDGTTGWVKLTAIHGRLQ